MSVYEYVRELEGPTATKDRPRGRRHQDYRPSKVIDIERSKRYGCRAMSYELQRKLLPMIKGESLKDIQEQAAKFKEVRTFNSRIMSLIQ